MNGIKRGFQLFIQFLGDLKWAYTSNHLIAQSVAWGVADHFKQDCATAISMGWGVLFSDPFQSSRKALQDFEVQFGAHNL